MLDCSRVELDCAVVFFSLLLQQLGISGRQVATINGRGDRNQRVSAGRGMLDGQAFGRNKNKGKVGGKGSWLGIDSRRYQKYGKGLCYLQ